MCAFFQFYISDCTICIYVRVNYTSPAQVSSTNFQPSPKLRYTNQKCFCSSVRKTSAVFAMDGECRWYQEHFVFCLRSHEPYCFTRSILLRVLFEGQAICNVVTRVLFPRVQFVLEVR